MKRFALDLQNAGPCAQYDAYAKSLLSHKMILAYIMAAVVPEYYGMTPKEILPYIEKNPRVSTESIIPGETNQDTLIQGTNLESRIPKEGTITFDIRFYTSVPDDMTDTTDQMLVDIEAQKQNPGHGIMPRAVFYNSRQISAELDRDFSIPEFYRIKKVYSIWILMNPPKADENIISRFSFREDMDEKNPGRYGPYDLETVVVINLSRKLSNLTYSIQRFLEILFLPDLPIDEKIRILKTEYELEIDSYLEKEMLHMCNFSEAIREIGEEKGIQIGMKIGEANGIRMGEANGIQNMIEAFQECGLSWELTYEKIQQKFHLSDQRTKEHMESSWRS